MASFPVAAGDESYRNLLDADEFQRACLLSSILQTQLHYLVHALHKSIQILSLSMASPQRGHGSNVVALLVPFDEHCERACTFHMPILSFEKQLDGETGWSGYITRHGVTFSPRCTRARSP